MSKAACSKGPVPSGAMVLSQPVLGETTGSRPSWEPWRTSMPKRKSTTKFVVI